MSSEEALEAGARAYCLKRGWNPDGAIVDLNNTITQTRPRWQRVANMLKEHATHEAAMRAARLEMFCAGEHLP